MILDLGCGTGLVTEQLAENGHMVIGCDIDVRMITSGIEQHSANMAFKLGRAEKIPFRNNCFDLTTVFSAFHWFDQNLALKEIKRVLKPEGYLVVANKNEADDLKREYRRIIRRFIDGDVQDIKTGYKPKHLLWKGGFKDIQQRSVTAIEYFTPHAAMMYLQSVSLWNLVRRSCVDEARKAIEKFVQSRLNEENLIERKVNIIAIAGRK